MRRRDFIALAGATAAWPLAAHAQQDGRVRRIGALMLSQDDQRERAVSGSLAFEQTLVKLGWAVGRNIAIEYRWGVTDLDRARFAVAQILRLAPGAILATSSSALTAAQGATRTVPIVFTGISEPVERGFVASLARPGGNITGFINLVATIGGKWIELLKEIAPLVTRVTGMFNPASSFAPHFLRSAETAGRGLAVEVVEAHVRDAAEIEAVVTALAREPNAGLMLVPDGFTQNHRRLIFDLTARYRIPTIGQLRSHVAAGCLMSYGVDPIDSYRRAASYIDRILRGEKPADLPVQQPVLYETVINLKTAKTLGLTVPPSLLARADEVIE
jgi:putative ABC transport system substrate-binding protein